MSFLTRAQSNTTPSKISPLQRKHDHRRTSAVREFQGYLQRRDGPCWSPKRHVGSLGHKPNAVPRRRSVVLFMTGGACNKGSMTRLFARSLEKSLLSRPLPLQPSRPATPSTLPLVDPRREHLTGFSLPPEVDSATSLVAPTFSAPYSLVSWRQLFRDIGLCFFHHHWRGPLLLDLLGKSLLFNY